MLILLLTWLQILWLSLVFGIAAQRLVNRFMGWEDRTLPPDHLVVLGFLAITALGSLTVLFYPMNTLAEGGFILTHIEYHPDGIRAYTGLSGFRSFCLCTTDFILVKGRCLRPRASSNCFNFCSGTEHFLTDISCPALL